MRKLPISFNLLISFIFSIQTSICSGQNFFKAHASLAVVGSQVEGDGYGGYKKLGIGASVGIHRDFKKNWAWYADIMFIQKGSQKLPNAITGDNNYYYLNVNYIGIPLYLRFKQEKYFIDLGAEITSTILNKKERVINNNNAQNLDEFFPFNKIAYDYLWGFGYNLGEKWQLGIRGSFSIVPARSSQNFRYLYTSDFYSRIAGIGQYHNTVRIIATYNFIKKKNE
jgi:hypothetical protein